MVEIRNEIENNNKMWQTVAMKIENWSIKISLYTVFGFKMNEFTLEKE